MRELNYRSKAILNEVLGARDHRQDFVLIIEGKKAERLFRVVPYYLQYRDIYLRSSSKNIGALIAFGIRALTSPFFWGLCILADFEATESNFQLNENMLRVEFRF